MHFISLPGPANVAVVPAIHTAARATSLRKTKLRPAPAATARGASRTHLSRCKASAGAAGGGDDMTWWWTFGSVPELDALGVQNVSKRIMALSDAERAAPNAPRIIDVRTAGEYAGGHIEGAENASFLPPWSFPASVAPLIEPVSKDCELYVICLSAHRSIGALKWLRKQGYKNVKQLQGGMQAWRAAQLPEVKEGEQAAATQ